ncbi:hypothetical protein M0R45_009062 [Rubus argutus]|uniref:Uncharacterized protein n=1 Tax=Rubus argutus TaxID=59490 RepID=A0AAW1Y5Z0_RUBAR
MNATARLELRGGPGGRGDVEQHAGDDRGGRGEDREVLRGAVGVRLLHQPHNRPGEEARSPGRDRELARRCSRTRLNFLNILVDAKRNRPHKGHRSSEFEIVYNKITDTELAVVSSVVKREFAALGADSQAGAEADWVQERQD